MKRSRSARPAATSLLQQAQQLARRNQIPALCDLAPEVAAAPARARMELVSLVGSALTDSLQCEQALALFARVLRRTRRAADRAALLVHRARAFHELHDMDRGLQELERSHKLQGADPWPRQQAYALIVEAALLSGTGDQRQAERRCLRAVELCGPDPELAPLLVDAQVVLALTALRRGRLEVAEQWARQAVDRSDHTMGTRRADALRTLAVISANRNEFLRAIVSCRQALRIYIDRQSPRGLFKGYLSLGISYLTMGELDHAELFFDKCCGIAEAGEDQAPLSLAYSRLGHVYMVRGEPEDALEYYRRDLSLNRELNNPVSRGHPELNVGEALLEQGELDPSMQHLGQALELFAAVGDPVGQARAHLALSRGCALAAPGQQQRVTMRREADQHLRRARRLVAPLSRPELTSRCDVTEALVLTASGEVGRALARYRAGAAVLERLEDVATATHAAFHMGQALAAAGADKLAVELLSDALRNAELHQFQGLCRVLLKRLDALDETAVVDRTLRVGGRRGRSSHDLMRRKVRPEDLHGDSPAIKQVRRQIRQVAPTDVPVLITGETGTGKELVARAIHYASAVAKGPLVTLNCGAIPENLVESELFGHERGAFSGAVRDHTGCLERANHGTVFLDEIGDLPRQAQVKLLRFLATGEVRKVGETTPAYVEVRVIAATHRDLRQMMRDGQFREDLFYRLDIFEVHTPPVRELHGDIPELAQHFLATNTLALAKGIERVAPAAQELLERYRWPGNVRELENAVRRACVVCRGRALRPDHLPGHIASPTPRAPRGRDQTLKDSEQARVLEVLAQHHGNRTRAARTLGIHRNTLTRMLQRWQVNQ